MSGIAVEQGFLHMTPDISYSIRVEKAVLRAASRGTPTLDELCRAGRGAFPTEIKAALDRLRQHRLVGALSDEPKALTNFAHLRELWPEPSPMDYEWRFTPTAAEAIACRASEFGVPIACLGTPTVFASLLAKGVDAVLVDRNPAIVSFLKRHAHNHVLLADVGDLPGGLRTFRYPVIVLDPPWYFDHLCFWLMQASRITTQNATLIFPIFQELARPTAEKERIAICETLQNFGSLELFMDAVDYETPLFERETMVALGLPPFATWRVADLAVFNLGPSCMHLDVSPPVEDVWDHFCFGFQVVGLRRTAVDEGGLTVTPIYEDGSFLLRSVSARDPIKQHIGLWTSRNRAARVTGTSRLRGFLQALEAGDGPSDLIARTALSPEEERSLMIVLALIGC